MKKSRYVNHAQVMLIWPGDFDAQNVIGEALGQVLKILIIRIGQTHVFSSLFDVIS